MVTSVSWFLIVFCSLALIVYGAPAANSTRLEYRARDIERRLKSYTWMGPETKDVQLTSHELKVFDPIIPKATKFGSKLGKGKLAKVYTVKSWPYTPDPSKIVAKVFSQKDEQTKRRACAEVRVLKSVPGRQFVSAGTLESTGNFVIFEKLLDGDVLPKTKPYKKKTDWTWEYQQEFLKKVREPVCEKVADIGKASGWFHWDTHMKNVLFKFDSSENIRSIEVLDWDKAHMILNVAAAPRSELVEACMELSSRGFFFDHYGYGGPKKPKKGKR